ncbi:MAG: hypothetical protein HXX09_16540 [Bacteroidetes bacterium]|nr:hypothetical protein [Bacteroidota bacterium]
MTKKSELAKARYKKGLDFENEVAKYMTEVLKYDDVEVRPRVSGKISDRGYEIDVLAKINDRGGDTIKKIAIVFFVTAIVLIFWWAFDIVGEWAIIIALVLLVGSIAYVLISKSFVAKYIWIECKNLKSKTKRSHIFELTQKYKDYKQNKYVKWNIINLMFFSVSGYDSDAKEFAKENGIICYEKADNEEFVKTNIYF